MIERKLVAFFLWLMREGRMGKYAAENAQGHCCSGISEQCEMTGVEAFARRIIAQNGSEYRINSAGLKLYITINKPLNKVSVRIGGDQANDYPTFVSAVQWKLIDMGLDDDTYYSEPKNPTVVRNIMWKNLT